MSTVCQALGSGMMPSLASLNLEGAAIPVRQLNGFDPTETLDLSGRRFGGAIFTQPVTCRGALVLVDRDRSQVFTSCTGTTYIG